MHAIVLSPYEQDTFAIAARCSAAAFLLKVAKLVRRRRPGVFGEVAAQLGWPRPTREVSL